jgi:hypothetical protein
MNSSTYQTVWCHNPLDQHMNIYCCANLKISYDIPVLLTFQNSKLLDHIAQLGENIYNLVKKPYWKPVGRLIQKWTHKDLSACLCLIMKCIRKLYQDKNNPSEKMTQFKYKCKWQHLKWWLWHKKDQIKFKKYCFHWVLDLETSCILLTPTGK